jgi:competence protein ComEC
MRAWSKRFSLCVAILLLVSTLTCSCARVRPDPLPENALRVTFLDVGQGDCILLECGEETMLIDAGSNQAEEQLASLLERLELRRLTYAVFTHSDQDHIGGADRVLTQLGADTVLVPALSEPDTSTTYLRMTAAARACNAQMRSVLAGEAVSVGGATVTVLAPSAAAEGNAASLVLRVAYGETAVLLTGDATVKEEAALLECCPELRSADLLKLGHHGSSTSTSAAFLDAVSPSFSVISCAAVNEYGHPGGDVLRRLQERPEITIHSTAQSGSLQFVSDGKSFVLTGAF